MKRIFVYGTLKRNKYNNYLLGNDAEYLYDTFIKGQLFVGLFPMLFEGNKDIQGEIWVISNEAFKEIKDMEEKCGYITKKQVIHSEPTFIFYYPQEEMRNAIKYGYREISNF